MIDSRSQTAGITGLVGFDAGVEDVTARAAFGASSFVLDPQPTSASPVTTNTPTSAFVMGVTNQTDRSD